MLRYLENERYSATCDKCGRAEHFYCTSKDDARRIASSRGLTIFIYEGLDYILCPDCVNRYNFEEFKIRGHDYCISEKDAVKRFKKEYRK